jgi:Zn-dependent protease
MLSLRFLRAGHNLSGPLPGIDLAQLFIAFSVLLFSITVHGWAQVWVADRLGDGTARRHGRLSLDPMAHLDLVGTLCCPAVAWLSGLPLLGWGRRVAFDGAQRSRPRRDTLLVAAAGPASHLGLAVAAAALLAFVPVAPVRLGEPNVSAPIAALLSRGVQLNIMLAIFTWLPIPPLDGGMALTAMLPRGLSGALERVRPYGGLLLGTLMVTRALTPVVMPPYNLLRAWLL